MTRTLAFITVLLFPLTAFAADYETEIKGLFKQHCVACHGPLKQEAELRLDAGALILKGGAQQVVLPGKSGESELLRRVLSDNEDERMPPEGARLSGAEIELLRNWIDSGAQSPKGEVFPQTPSEHWAFQPVQRPAVPEVQHKDWCRNSIDHFVLAELESRSLPPPSSASSPQLLRRLYLDLIGLPPTLAEQDAFAASGDLEAVIQELLARPEYGERWARHWLDVVRYADSNGYERDSEKPFVWRYRDYVIEALNHDKPFNRFVLEQLAGDELPDATLESNIATGFLRLGHWDDEPADPAVDRFDQLDDIVSTTSQAFLALNIGCARCHDHKFEPLSSHDYYSMLAVFSPLERPRDGRTERTISMDGTEIYAWRETLAAVPDTYVLKRGSPTNLGELVHPAVPNILVENQPTFPSPDDKTTHRRLGLAHWIANAENPLTARVIVNRVWQQHFGQGLVETANDFGLMGSAPSHPELLDWLAHWFMHDANWSLKKLHHLILTSHTWQMAKSPNSLVRYRRLEVEAIRDSMLAVSGKLNPQHFGPPMRPRIQKVVIEANTDKERIWQASEEPDASRRSIYVFVKRGLVVPLFETLDFADTVSSCPQRPTTTIAPQALSLFNGEFAMEQARHFSERVKREAGDDPAQQIELAWQLALCRLPTTSESSQAQEFLQVESLEQLCRVILNLNEFVYTD